MSDQMPEQHSRNIISPTRSPEERVGLLRTLYQNTILTWQLFWDGRVGFWPKLIPILALIYLVSPIDLIPAALLGPLAPLGAVDDLGFIVLALNLFVKAAPPDVVREYLRLFSRQDAPEDWADEQNWQDDVIEGQAEIIDDQRL